MLQSARLFVASFAAVTMIAGCAVSTAPPESDGDSEDVGSAEQPLPSSGYYRVYYSDAAHTETVGWVNWDCYPEYREYEGDTSPYYWQFRFDCPGFDSPLLPTCENCVTHSANGQSWQSCYNDGCNNPPPW